MTNKWKKYNQPEPKRVLILEKSDISEAEEKRVIEKLTDFIKKRAGMDFVFIVIFIIIMLLVWFLISYFK